MKLKEREEQYLRFKYCYYILGEPIIEDAEFDEFENVLKKLGSKIPDLVDFPTIKEIEEFGLDPANIVDSDERDEAKYPLSSPFLSLEKIQINDEKKMPKNALNLFFSRLIVSPSYESTFEATLKYDGNAMENNYFDGKLDRSLTRKGKDRTSKMKFLVPETIPYKGKVQIRGEILIDKELWNRKYNRPEPGKVSNPRSYIGGFLGRDEYNISEVKELVFVAYNLIGFDENGKTFPIENTMKTLEEWGFNKEYKPITINFKSNEFESMYYQMKKYREECPYLIDGIVIKYPENLRNRLGATSHHPKWAVAVKFVTELSITYINEIIWTIAKTGDLCPKAILEPVELLGTMVSRATLSNLGNIIRLRAFPGAKVSLKKSGEIIPMIVRVLEPSPNEDFYIREYEDFLKECQSVELK